MPRPALSFWTFAPVLAVVFAIAAIALVLTARNQPPPRLALLTPVDGTLRAWSGFRATTLNLSSKESLLTIDASRCAANLVDLRAGDGLTVWIDKELRAWRIMRTTRPICTFLQSTTAEERSRKTRRMIALACALASAAATVGMLIGRRRQQRLIEDPPEA